MARRVRAIQVAQEADLAAVVHQLAVDVQNQRGHRVLGEEGALRAERPRHRLVVEGGDGVVPPGVGAVEELERPVGVAGTAVGPVPRVEHVGVVRHRPVAEERAGPGGKQPIAMCIRRQRNVVTRSVDAGRLDVAQSAVIGRFEIEAVGDRLPGVLVVGQPVEPRPQVDVPVELHLADELRPPLHAAILALVSFACHVRSREPRSDVTQAGQRASDSMIGRQ